MSDFDGTAYQHAYPPKPGGFGWALAVLEDGGKVARKGWNGKEMWAVLVSEYLGRRVAEHFDLEGQQWIGMKTADGHFVPWLASQTDMLAKDWVEVDYSEEDNE